MKCAAHVIGRMATDSCLGFIDFHRRERSSVDRARLCCVTCCDSPESNLALKLTKHRSFYKCFKM